MSVATEPCTRPELEEAMRNHVATIRRMPAHWFERRGTYHAKINELLDLWQLIE